MLISPADYVIRKLGGLTKTAATLGLAVSTVQGWKIRKRIPQDHWAALADAAKENGKIFELRDFIVDHEVKDEERVA